MVQADSERQAVADALDEYSFAIDQCDWTRLVDVFTPDGTYDVGAGVVKGNTEIADMVRGAVEHLAVTQHLNGNQRIEITGKNSAIAFSYVTCMQVATEERGGGYWNIGGDYTDELVRTDGRWRISARVFTLRWQLGDPSIMS